MPTPNGDDPLRTTDHVPARPDGTVLGVGYSSAGLRVVSRSPGGGLTIRDIETDQPARRLGGRPPTATGGRCAGRWAS